MEFLFSKEIDKINLRQGDLLQRTDNLKNTIAQAHPHYADATSYTHFIVLTQSCDLIRRNKKCKARYITLAAVRPLDILVDRQIEKFRFDLEFPLQVCQKDRETLANQFLERLLHNTEDSYFFIRKGSAPTVTRDLCVFLPLSIALRENHYDACLSAKVAQLDHIFAAKLGWLTGNLYSRIATPDFEEELDGDPDTYKNEFFDEVLHKRTAWLSTSQARELKRLLKNWNRTNPNQELSQEMAKSMLGKLPEDVEFVAKRAISILQNAELIDGGDEVAEKARNLLANDVNFQKLVRTSI